MNRGNRGTGSQAPCSISVVLLRTSTVARAELRRVSGTDPKLWYFFDTADSMFGTGSYGVGAIAAAPAYGTYGGGFGGIAAAPVSYGTTAYAAPMQQSYAAPMQSYAAPMQSYAAPMQSYAAPMQSYAAPMQSYAAPMQSYGSYGGGATYGGGYGCGTVL
jgi:hypothetical protein